MPTKENVLAWSKRAAIAAAVLLIVGVAGAWLFLGTQSGRDTVARLAEDALSDAQTTVRIAKVSGNLASDFRVGELSVADAAGNVVILENAQVAWSPTALLGGTLDIETLEIGRVSITGNAGDQPDTAEAPGAAAPPPLAIRIGTFRVREIALDANLLGEAQRLSLAGSLSVRASPPTITVKARLARLDDAPGHADIDVAYTARPAQFIARIDVEEPAGGPIARLAGLPAEAALSMQLKGDGPPDGWRGRLTARAGSLAELSSDLAVSVAESGATLSLDGTAAVAGLLPPETRLLAAPSVRFQAALAHATTGEVTLKELTASTGALSARIAGRYDPARDTVAGTFTLSGSDSLSLPGVSPGLVIDGMILDGTLDGTIAEPAMSAQFSARRLSLQDMNAAGVAGRIRFAVGPDRPMALSGAVRLDSVDAGKNLPIGLLGKALAIELDGLIRTDGTSPRLDMKIASGPLAGEINATLPRSDNVEGRYAFTHASLGDFLTGIGVPLRGAAEVKGTFRTDLSSGDTRLGFAGAMNGIVSNDAWFSASMGPRTSFNGALAWQQSDETLRVTAFEIASDAIRVRADATVRLAVDRLEATYSASLADLRRFAGPAGVPLAGRARATGTAKGNLQAPDVMAQIATHGLVIDGVAVGEIGAGVAARPTPTGIRAAARLGGALAGKPLTGDFDMLADGDILRLQRLKIAIGRNGLSGNLAIDTARSRLTGDATLTLSDARDLPAITGLPPLASGAGSVRLGLRFDGAQQFHIDADLKSLALPGDASGAVSAGTLIAKATIRDPFAAFSVDGTIRAEDLRGEGTRLRAMELTAKGSRTSLAWTVSADGAQPVSLSLKSAGTASLAGDDVSLQVDKLDGTVADHVVRLRAAAPVRLAGGTLNAGPVDLAIGDGAMRLRVVGTGDRLDVSGDIDKLPLTLASLVEPGLDLAGTVSGKIRLAGAAPLPTIDVALTASDVRPSNMRQEDFKGLSIEATLLQDSAATRMVLKLRGPDDTRADGTLQTSPLVGLGPLRLVDIERQTLSGKLEAHAKLGVIDRVMALGEDRIAGQLQANVTVAGTVARPVLKGTARLAKGGYEGAATGAVLRDAEAHIEFTGEGARLVSLTAIDGNGGRLNGSGTFAFESGTSATDRLTVRLESFTALRRPEAEIVATGAITVKGPLDAPAVDGKLTVEKAELRIPDRLPENVVELEVEEVNLPPNAAQTARPTEPSASRNLSVSLDLGIDFPGRTFVRGRGLDSEWKGALTVKGTSVTPVIAGKLSVVRGTFAFAGKTFVLKSGSVTFSGNDQTEPEIDATAEARLKTLVAQVQISGRLSKPTLTVTSDPPLPQEEVLANILFDRTTGQLTAIQAAQLAQTAATLSGSAGGTNIMDRVRQALGVDVLNVETGEAGTGPSLKAGKYITEDVFLSVRQGAEPGSQKVGVEVEVLPNLSVESDIGGDSSSNFGVNWKFDY